MIFTGNFIDRRRMSSPDDGSGGITEREGDIKVKKLLADLEVGHNLKTTDELVKRLLSLNVRKKNEGGDRAEEEGTHLEHSLEVRKMCHDLVEKYFKEELGDLLPQIDLACIMHDVGKTGPVSIGDKEYDSSMQEMFVTLYSFINKKRLNGKPLPENTIKESLENFFPFSAEKQQDYISLLLQIGIKPEEKMRRIYDLHGEYTKSLLEDADIDPEVTYMACNHHSLGVRNGRMEIDGLVPNEEKQKKLDFAVALMYFCDFFEAASSRGGKEKNEILPIILSSVADKYKPEIEKIIQVAFKNQ